MPVVEHTVELAVGCVVVVQTVGRFLAVFALRPCFLIFEQGDGSTVVVMRRAQIGTRPLLRADAHDSVFVAIDVADDFRIEVGVDLDSLLARCSAGRPVLDRRRECNLAARCGAVDCQREGVTPACFEGQFLVGRAAEVALTDTNVEQVAAGVDVLRRDDGFDADGFAVRCAERSVRRDVGLDGRR